MNSCDVERAVVRFFDYRKHLAVANASWGAGVHECDILLLTGAGYGIEVEIKVSRSDIIADQKKPHHQKHGNPKIRKLFFAIPDALNTPDIHTLIPGHAGIIVVTRVAVSKAWVDRCEVVRIPKVNSNARPWTDREKYELARLGTMRFWYRQAPQTT